MPEFVIESIDDARLDPYRDLKQPGMGRSGAFVAEGEKLVLRLLDSTCRTDSILCTTTVLDRLRDRLPNDVDVYVADTPLISGLIGFQFHRGILACGARPPAPSLESLCRLAPGDRPSLIVACPELRDPTNLGTIIRTAAAFGATGLIAGDAGTDPFSRRVLRTSMGSVLRLPIVQTDKWDEVLGTLHQFGYETIATVLDPTAEPLEAAPCPARAAILLGNEAEGLSDKLVIACHRRVTLLMASGVDSLNVSVAAGIILHHFARPLNRKP